MITGQLDRQITLRQPTTSTNSYGEETTTYSDYATVFASVLQQGSKEVFYSGKVSEVDVVFKIRFIDAVDVDWQVNYDSKTYKITGTKELGRQDGFELMAQVQT